MIDNLIFILKIVFFIPHQHLHILARVAKPKTGRRGMTISEEVVKALAVGFIRRRLGLAGIKAQCLLLLGRLDGMGTG